MQKKINQDQTKKVNHLQERAKNYFTMYGRTYGPQLEEKEYSQHVYDINLTELYFNFQTRFSNNQSFLKGFEHFLKAVIKRFDITFEDITDKKIPFIVKPLEYHYSASLTYQLMIMDKYKIPLFLNYHYATFPPPNQIDFVYMLEYNVYEFVANNTPKEVNSDKIREALSKWIEKKQNNKADYFLNIIRDRDRETVLETFFFYYAEKSVKDKDYHFIEINDQALKRLIDKFINFNSRKIRKIYNKEDIVCKWNGSVVALAYLIHFLISIKKNGYNLFDQINTSKFIDTTFGDKKNKRIGEETIIRNINRFQKEDLSKPVQEQDETLRKIWEQIQFPSSNI